MNSKTEQPEFNFLITRNGHFDYWLFDKFDDAINTAKALQAKYPTEIIRIYEPLFNNITREYFAQNTFNIIDNKIIYDKHALPSLHMKFYTDAGEWQNNNIKL